MKPVEHRSGLMLLAAGGSAALLLGAFAFQYIGGLAPCPLCLWQRWPHAIAVVIGLIGWRFPSQILGGLGALAALATAGIGIFHSGVERTWWEGLKSCSGALDLSKLSAEAAYEAIMTARVVRCDEAAWEMAGLSMASWNALMSIGLAAIWVIASLRARKAR